MKKETDTIEVNKIHTDEMVRGEMMSMLGATEIKLTLGGLMSLVIAKSPYIFGGKVSEEDLAKAFTFIEHGSLDIMAFHTELQNAIDEAFRVFEILVPDDDPTSKKGKTSEMETFSPEWFSDIISQACQSMPSLTYNSIMYEMPLVTIFHLNLSTARRNGAITRRPEDLREALKILKERREKKKQ